MIEHDTTWVDLLTKHFSAALRYGPAERDMVVQEHQFESTDRHGQNWLRTSTLVAYGIPNGDSATARTVALPAAIAAKHMLEGRYTLRGVRAPVHAQIYEPVLQELQSCGLEFKETKRKLD